MRVITFNTQGIEQAVERGFFDWALQQNADVICLQDLRAKEYQLDDAKYHPEGYFPFFFDAFEDDYSGVAIYSREMPKAVMTGMGFELCDFHGRFIQADFERYSIASLCVPDGRGSDEALAVKREFMEGLGSHLRKTLRKRRDFIFCGTYNLASQVQDVSNADINQTVSGFLPADRAWLEEVLTEMEYTDAFRKVNKQPEQYTWFPSQDDAFARNQGARFDYQLVSSQLAGTPRHAEIYRGQQFSEHAPLIIDYDL